jgi:hypothetical protein
MYFAGRLRLFADFPEVCSILVYERGLMELEQAAHRC